MTDQVRSYLGHRHQGHAVVDVIVSEGTELLSCKPLTHLVRHSPTGFGWGTAGGSAGMADLARSILVDALGTKALCDTCKGSGKDGDLGCPECDHGIRCDLAYQQFRDDVIAGLPHHRWVLSQERVVAWYEAEKKLSTKAGW